MYQEESIYNLVEQEKIKPVKETTYVSKYPYDLHPTATTFCLKTTSYPGVSNINGDYQLPRGAHRQKAMNATFGKPEGSYRKDPNSFTRKGHSYIDYPEITKLRPDTDFKKPPIPSLDDKPIMGLKSDKNYITANAVDVILMGAKKKPQTTSNYLTKNNYGKVPEYLSKIREDIEREYKAIREMQIRNEEDEARKKKKLEQDEVGSLREGLQKRLAQVKKDYGSITHKTVFDTLVCQRKKIYLEKEIQTIEADLDKLNRGNVVIDMTR
mmetsp:Transcript_22121/g.23063  ORF Transcript_22121/g.23063 Transcript_22121/m.23063 type:complete len:268 (+) Transcript_22121:29-832(+)